MSSQSSLRCRSCQADKFVSILDLGQTPLANSLLTREQLNEPENIYPLELVLCPACTLVQITETVPPEILFRDYVYFSSFSDTMLEHAENLVTTVLQERQLGPQSLAMEVASNDGYLLQFYKRAGVPVLGIEPAINVARIAEEQRGVRSLPEFFNEELALTLAARGERADVLHANNVLAHVADLNGFVSGIRHVLSDNGIAIIEVPYIVDLVERCEFDTIYHEHLCYFSLTALAALFRRHQLAIVSVERVAIHGGSLRLRLARAEAAAPDSTVAALLEQELSWGVGDRTVYSQFAARVEQLKQELIALLKQFKTSGARIAAYGAAAKGSTLLNYFKIGRETLDFVADRSTHKQGRYMPGVHIPILEPNRILEDMPAYLLLLTWNFAAEILEQQAEYRRRGGRFIIPVPEVRVM